MMQVSPVLSGLMGVCVGDALGVPVEFTSRSDRLKNPVTTMMGYETYNQPPGTWSDDSSLTFCLADSLCQGFDLNLISRSFCHWFRIGNTTLQAVWNLQHGAPPSESGATSDRSNGNGSLMRILPMAFLYKNLEFTELIERTHQVSGITHAHPRSLMLRQNQNRQLQVKGDRFPEHFSKNINILPQSWYVRVILEFLGSERGFGV